MIRPRADGLDIISGLLNPGIDFMADPAFDDISNRVLFNPAAVAFLAIPEPGTAALLSLGLLGLVLVRRRA
jgi:hypothetical protein